MSVKVDLHTHSSRSDGTASPAEVVRRAVKLGLRALVLTDHDTVDGWAEASAEARSLGLRFACGVEINTCEETSVHILGYGIDPASPLLAEKLADYRSRRRVRIGRIVERLRGLGVDISEEEVWEGQGGTVGRPHVADLMQRKRLVRSRKDAFRRYLRKGGPAYVPSLGPTAGEAIELIRASGGWASLAHPCLLKKNVDFSGWVAMGLEGLEAYYPAHSGPQTERLVAAAQAHGLAVTGGSDYHGPGTDHEDLGSVPLPEAAFELIKDRLRLEGAS